MAKIALCDVCIRRHDKLTRATKYMHIKGHKDLRIDLCNVHTFELQKKFPKMTPEYVQYVYEMAHNKKLSLEEAENILRSVFRRR